MNANARLFVNAPNRALAARLAALAGVLAVAGCAGNPFASAQIDPASPVAGDVAKAVSQNRRYPTFADIPKVPADVPTPKAFGLAAAQLTAEREQLEAQTAPATWSLNNTEGFASRAQGAAGPEASPGASSQDETEAFARKLRERATPPPPPK